LTRIELNFKSKYQTGVTHTAGHHKRWRYYP